MQCSLMAGRLRAEALESKHEWAGRKKAEVLNSCYSQSKLIGEVIE